MNISKFCGDVDIFLLKMIGNVLFDCWFYNNFDDFIEYVVFVIFW